MIRLLGPADLEALTHLKNAASWNQTEADLRRNLSLAPMGCFGIEFEGRMAATATAIAHGDELAWIGMVITDPNFRGRGLARKLMAHSLEYLRSAEIDRCKLDASPMGEPLYRSLGFERECGVERWERSSRAVALPAVDVSAIADFRLDRKVFAADRSALLESQQQCRGFRAVREPRHEPFASARPDL